MGQIILRRAIWSSVGANTDTAYRKFRRFSRISNLTRQLTLTSILTIAATLLHYSTYAQSVPAAIAGAMYVPAGGGPPPTPQTVRFYLEGSGSSAISPAYDAAWNVTSGAARRPMGTSKASTSEFSTGGNFTAINTASLNRQFVSAITVASNVTITGNVYGQVRARLDNTFGTTAYSTVLIRVISSGGTVRGTLLNTLATGAGGTAIASSYTNRNTPASTAMSSVAAQSGDYIVVEIGGTLTAAGSFPRAVTLPFQTLVGTDLPVNNTTTSGDSWIEFAFDQTVF